MVPWPGIQVYNLLASFASSLFPSVQVQPTSPLAQSPLSGRLESVVAQTSDNMKLSWVEAAVLTAASVASAQDDLAYSPPYYPSPWSTGQGEWAEAYNRAVQIVSQMTLDEKVNLTSGTGYVLYPSETYLC
ncbi:hypothetical protein BJX66DRAFT_256731 [Aspergillus keveii]|uniref:Glycoside hydrolase family 3 N-terminal domain-containing protein n=1 Tax=Aspergillus keveii TaxID=714993 RepID=A0ABR4GJP7_9EURO